MFLEHAKKYQDKELLYVGAEAISYSGLIERTEIIARSLKALKIGENQKVGLIIPNSISWYELFWSTIRIGAQPVPVDPQSGEWELERLINLADIEVCFIARSYKFNDILKNVSHIASKCPKLRNVVIIDSENNIGTGCNNLNDDKKEWLPHFIDFKSFISLREGLGQTEIFVPNSTHIMSLACTSGSTGNPKILSVPAQGFYEALEDMANYLAFNEEDCMLIGMPLYHQGGFGMGLQTVIKGGSIIYEPQFNPITFLKLIEEKKVTIIQLTATLAKILLSTPNVMDYDFSHIKCCYFAGEVLPREIAKVFTDQLHIRVINVIGSSETATMTVWDSKEDGDVDPSDFKALPFTKIRVLDEEEKEVSIGEVGQLCIYTTAVIMNYYKNKEESKQKIHITENKRWFYTGDLVQKQPNNRIRFVGRSKRIIKRGANLVHSEEVEAFLLTHPNIQAVAIKGEVNELMGQQIVAYVQTVEGQILTRGDLAKFCKGKISNYKIPDQVVVNQEIPHDIGKVQYKYIANKQE